MISKEIFREYDIRGNSSIFDKATAYNIGYHFAKMNMSKANKRFFIAYDSRESSLEIFRPIIEGIRDAEGNISYLGLVPTPLLYFADKKFRPAGSLMLTASHNDIRDRGVKLLANNTSFAGEKIQKLFDRIQNDLKIYEPHPHKSNKIYKENIDLLYLKRILEDIKVDNNLKIVWDCSNGTAGSIISKLINNLPNKNYLINNMSEYIQNADSVTNNSLTKDKLEVDIEQNIDNDEIDNLKNKINSEQADFGIKFDIDADRILVITNQGKVLHGDQLLCIYAKEILTHKPNSILVADVKSSNATFEYIRSLGGNPVMWKTGHSNIKSKIKELRAEIGAELSGHIYFLDKYYGYDDGIYAALRLINIVSNEKKTLEELSQEIPKKFTTPEIKIKIEDNAKFEIIEQIKEKLKSMSIDFKDIDGIRCNLQQGWWLIRASNTEPAIIARAESNKEKELELVLSNLNSIISEYGIRLPSQR